MKAKIGNWGGSSALRLPKSAVERLGLKTGSEVELVVDDKVISIVPVRPRYTLAELVSQAGTLTPPTVIDDEPIANEWPSN